MKYIRLAPVMKLSVNNVQKNPCPLHWKHGLSDLAKKYIKSYNMLKSPLANFFSLPCSFSDYISLNDFGDKFQTSENEHKQRFYMCSHNCSKDVKSGG